METKFKYIEIIKIEGREVVKRIDVSYQSERNIDKIQLGILRNMDTDNYTVCSISSKVKLEII